MKAIRFSNAITMLLFAALSTLTLLTLTGCQSLRGGTPVQNEAMQSLEPGMPYQEVVAELGPPLTFINGEQAIAYPWHTSRRCVTTSNPRWLTPDGYEVVEFQSVHHVLCLKFDEQKRLQEWKYLEAPSAEALEQEMKTWAISDVTVITAQAQSR